MTRYFSLLVALLLTLSLTAPAPAADEPVDLSAMFAAIEQRIDEAEQQPVLTRTEQKCVKAFKRVVQLLQDAPETRTDSAKDLKKIEARLRKWFVTEFDDEALARFEEAQTEFDVGLDEETKRLVTRVRDVERAEEVRAVERLIAKIEKQVAKAGSKRAAAAAATSLKKRAKHQLAASKALDKAAKLAVKLPDPGPGGAGEHDVAHTSIVTAPDLEGVPQLYALDVCVGIEEPVVPRQLSAGDGPVTEVTVREDGEDFYAFFAQDGNAHVVDIRTLAPTPTQLTEFADTEGTVSLCPSPDGESLLVSVLDGPTIFIVVDSFGGGEGLFELEIVADSRVTGCTWIDPGTTCVVSSIEGSNPPLARLDLCTLENDFVSLTPIAGGSIDNRSCGDVAVSPDGKLAACTAISSMPGTRLIVVELETGDELEIHDSAVAMGSDQDPIASRDIAGVWTNATTLVFNGVPGLRAASFPNGLDSVTTTSLDGAGQFYTVHGQSDALVCIDDQQDRQMMAIDAATLEVTPLGTPGLFNRASALSDVINGIVFTNTAGDGSLVVDLFDADDGSTSRVAVVQPDANEVPRTFINKFRIGMFTPGVLSVLFNVSTNDTGVAGIKLTTAPLVGGVAGAFAALNTIAAQPENTEFSNFAFRIVDPAPIAGTDVGFVLEFSEQSFTDGVTRERISAGPAEVDGIDVELILFDLSEAGIDVDQKTTGFHYYF